MSARVTGDRAGTGRATAARTAHGATAVRLGSLSLVTTRRRLVVVAVLIVLLVAFAVLALGTGTIRLSAAEVFSALGGDAERRVERVVWGIRVPRVAAALVVGAALALSGAVFQNLSGNPLGSPDIIGFVTGAATGAVLAITLFAAGPVVVALSALGGGLATAVIVLLLAHVRGRGAPAAGGGYRLVLVGIGVGALLASVNDLLLTRSSAEAANAAQIWLVGNLASRNADVLGPCLVMIGLAVPCVLLLGRRMAALQLGETAAAQAGVEVPATRLAMVAVGVVLVAAATAATGPISFVALAAPQIAWRLVGRGRPALWASALTGAALLLGADLVSQHLPVDMSLPVGLVAAMAGGVYLLFLLMRGQRS